MRDRRIIALALVVAISGGLSALLAGDLFAAATPAYKPEGEMRWAVYVTISPAWFDPAEVPIATLTTFWFCYALHDALVKPMPGNPMAPSLAESWTESDEKAQVQDRVDDRDRRVSAADAAHPTRTLLSVMAGERTGFLQMSAASYKQWGKDEVRLRPGGTGPFKLARWE